MAVSIAIVLVVALVARLAAASLVVFPVPEDTAYYVGAARNLLAGEGLTSNALWSYNTPPLSFPRPAFEVWLPLPTFLAAIPMAILGATFPAAQVSSIVVGSLVPVLAWQLGADVGTERGLAVGRRRVLALGAGLTSAVYLPLVLHSALPDSTMPFAALSVAACLVMTRIVRAADHIRALDGRVILLGALIGLAAWTRNEAAFIGLVWLIVVWRIGGLSVRQKVGLVAVPGAIAVAIFAPWMIRDWLEFGTPLPGQALTNALSVTGYDIFAWNDPPTLSRYLSVGPARLLEMRVEGIGHNLLTVLLLPGIPVAFVGLVGLPWFGRIRAMQPLTLLSLIAFAVTSLVFPVSTTWGTYLHAAGPAHVLLVVSALLALDAAIERIGMLRGWTRPVAWLGATLTIFGSLVFMAALMPSFGGQSRAIANRYEALEQELASAGVSIPDQGPIITNFPIWLADATGARALALPTEPAADVLHLARQFGATLLVIHGEHVQWPAVIDAGGPDAACFQEVTLGRPAVARLADALDGTRVFRFDCP